MKPVAAVRRFDPFSDHRPSPTVTDSHPIQSMHSNQVESTEIQTLHCAATALSQLVQTRQSVSQGHLAIGLQI